MTLRRVFSCALVVALVAALLLQPPPALYAQNGGCHKSVAISIAASNTQELVPAITGETVQVCGFVVTEATAAGTAQFKTGTGTTCGTGTVNLTGAMTMVTNGFIAYGDGSSVIFSGNLSSAVCVTAGSGGAVAGVLTYR
jgi:hypothetical protein